MIYPSARFSPALAESIQYALKHEKQKMNFQLLHHTIPK